MLLQKLKEYAEQRMELPPVLYNEAPVRYVIDLDNQGRLLSPVPTDTAGSDRRTKWGMRRLVPQVQRSSGIKPLLLADNGEYTLGVGRPGSRPERVAQQHAAYRELVQRCVGATGSPEVQAVLSFLEGEPLSHLQLPDGFDPAANITFRVDGAFVTDLAPVQGFWEAANDPTAAEDGPAETMQCLVCGNEGPVLKRLQAKVKGVPGGQASGTSIISANAEAFESYGLEASLIAPTCAACGEKFTKALNELLAGETTSIRLAGAVFIFWTREPVEFEFRSYFDRPSAEQVKTLFEAPRSGRMAKMDATRFYATTLSGSGGRAVVRDWIDTTIGEVTDSLARWFRRQRIVDAYGQEDRPLGLYPLAAATVRDVSKELAPPIPRLLWRAALTGTPLPDALLYQAVRRNRAEQTVTHPRAALIKLVMASQDSELEEKMAQLDSSNTDPAYLCGRLLAVLESTQRLAIPGAKAGIVDRFFGTASSAPASVFPRLIRGAQPHLGKLERDRPGAHFALQRRLEDILAGLQVFPRVLTLQGQGIFALGYYHQRAYDRAQATQAAQARQRRDAAAAPVSEGDSPWREAELADTDDEPAMDFTETTTEEGE